MVEWLSRIKQQKEEEEKRKEERKRKIENFDKVINKSGLLHLIEEILAEVVPVVGYPLKISLPQDDHIEAIGIYYEEMYKKIVYSVEIHPESDGIYLLKRHLVYIPRPLHEDYTIDEKREINPFKITKDDVYEWFRFVVEGPEDVRGAS
jgi:hypothetical protein